MMLFNGAAAYAVGIPGLTFHVQLGKRTWRQTKEIPAIGVSAQPVAGLETERVLPPPHASAQHVRPRALVQFEH